MIECPRCKCLKVITGRLSINGRSLRQTMSFVPADLRWYQFRVAGAELKEEAFACPDCGLVWTSTAYPDSLPKLAERSEKIHR
jgi:hypothetical protein